MKTTILPSSTPSFTSSFTRAITALLLLTSACDQGEALLVDRAGVECSPEGEREPTEAQTLAHSKEIVVSNGHNEVTMLIASDDPELIAHYDDATFELVPVFERPELPESEDGGEHEETLDEAHDFSDSVLIEEGSVSLEDGAVGYELHEVDSGFRDATWTCSAPNTYTSAADFVRLHVANDPCVEARISTKMNFFGWFAETAHISALCSGVTMIAGRRHSYRVKLEVCPGSGHFITFFN